jgi:hypothetical protein
MNTITSRDTSNARIVHEATHQRSAPQEQEGPQARTLKPIDGERVETDISELVLCAQAEMAMARVTGPIRPDACFGHAAAARRWAYRAGLAARSGAPLPLGFVQSISLCEGFEQGQTARAHSINHLSLVQL